MPINEPAGPRQTCLSQGTFLHIQNYCDNKKIAEEVRALKGEDNTKIKGRRSNTVRMKEKSAKLL